MNNPFRTYTLLILLAALCGCQPVSESTDVVARVSDQELTAADLSDIIPINISPEDSAEMADKYISNWLKEQVIYTYAVNNLPPEEMDFEDEMENYRKSLVNFAFENHIVRQYLDTAVSASEIQEYYDSHQENFLLKDYTVRVKFCILDSLVEVDNKFEKLFNSEEPEDLVTFESFCVENGASYFIDEEKWLYFNDLLNEVPLEVYNVEHFLKKAKTLNFRANKKQYFLKIVDYNLKDDVSPLSLQEEKIRNIILNRRKIDLLSKMRDDLYKEAVRKNQIHTYTE